MPEDAELEAAAIQENPSSIEVTRNAKGEYAFKVKVYWGTTIPEADALAIVQRIESALRARYCGDA